MHACVCVCVYECPQSSDSSERGTKRHFLTPSMLPLKIIVLLTPPVSVIVPVETLTLAIELLAKSRSAVQQQGSIRPAIGKERVRGRACTFFSPHLFLRALFSPHKYVSEGFNCIKG